MLKTAESVAIGHPDKICDQISDAVLDACLVQDPHTRAAVEVLGGHGILTITGELTTRANIDIREIAERVYRSCGYEDNIGVTVNVALQSTEIGKGVDNEGAGDQGIMVGYATSATAEMLPLEVVLSRKLARAMGARDGKAQVTVDGGFVTAVITSVCNPDAKSERALLKVMREDIAPIVKGGKRVSDIWMRNPNGKWTVGGFHADTGLTGRKLAVDSYGPSIPLGGGAFSGKDATKVDRSAAYMARRIAVDYLRKRKANEVFVHLAYAIGVPEPVMAVALVDGKQEQITGYDLRPCAIIKKLKLQQPQFQKTAEYGHFGNNFIWEI